MEYSHIIWDWNGTLVDDVHWNIACVNKMLRQRGLPVIPDLDAYYRVFGFPIKEYYRKIGFDFEKEPYEELAVEWTNLYYGPDAPLSLFSDAIETLHVFRAHRLHQSVLSASEAGQLQKHLAKFGILGEFEEVLGISDIYAGSKIHLGKEYLRRVQPRKAVLLGDTLHDADTARALGVDCILVSRGHQSRAALERSGCPVAETLTQAANWILR